MTGGPDLRSPGFKYIDLFAGIGGFHMAADALGGRCVFASEIDREATRAYEANYGLAPRGDIKVIGASEIPDHDIMFAGFPCQPFSIIGNRLGFADIRGTLFFEISRILEAKRPPMFLLENVKQLYTHDQGKTLRTIVRTLERLGYKVSHAVLNALDYGLPQKRERTLIAGFLNHAVEFSFPGGDGPGRLEDILEPDEDVDPKHFASDMIVRKRKAKHESGSRPGIWHENKSGNVCSYPYSCALRAGASYNYLLVNGIRRLTPREMLRLQGFPDKFRIVCNDSQTRRQVGNAVPVNLVKAVLKEMLLREAKAGRRSGKRTA
ncbi:MAG: DNA (cytosine-5-)-methyltransferase [Deltaproteobacteria bacterium]|jgi:DNA (cytosine-5)-methyltransferase 1|nr:DNA (cytosine-5-)-methyltransferase [Deltaproteobacteria bacterium]